MRFSFWRSKRQQQLEQEIAGHLEMAERDHLERGESAQHADSAALREFGNVALVQHVTREQWGWLWLEEFLLDVRYAARMMRRNLGVTFIAVLTLALGIGANTAIFSLVDGVLLRPLPLPDANRLVTATAYYPKGAFVVMRNQSRTMDFIAQSDNTAFNLTGRDLPIRLTGNSVSANWFAVLGVQAAQGRTFQEGEDQPGKDDVVILSHSLWERRFSSDTKIIGRSILLEGAHRRIVGVMPADFRFPSPKTELWVPLNLDPRKTGDYWGSSYMPVTARLRPEATLEQAKGDLVELRPKILAGFAWRMPDDTWAKSRVISLQEAIVGDARASLLILLGAVGLLLLIACANVANLLLARATTRQKEIALRAALGASRWRIVRQLISESVLISVIGGALGIRMAMGARRKEVLYLVVGQGGRLALAGVAVGLLGALALTRLMTSLLYGVGTADPSTYFGVALLLLLIAVAASYIPARRAMRVDPTVALRYE